MKCLKKMMADSEAQDKLGQCEIESRERMKVAKIILGQNQTHTLINLLKPRRLARLKCEQVSNLAAVYVF